MDVLCLMDSVTRFAMAQREIGLAAGEPPTTKGYTPLSSPNCPSCWSGPGTGRRQGSITGLFTVLVDGDDTTSRSPTPCGASSTATSCMERAIAERGRFPAINVLKSISRTMPGCQTPLERETVAGRAPASAAYANMEELIRIGAYRSGADAQVDRAITLNPSLETFL